MVHARQRVAYMTTPQIKALGTESQISFPGSHRITQVVTMCDWGIKHVLNDSIGRGHLEACTMIYPM